MKSLYQISLFILLLLQAAFASARIVVKVTGVDSGMEERLMTVISLGREKQDEEVSAARVKTLFQRAHEEIELLLKTHGYYQSRIYGTLEEQGDDWVAGFTIEPGVPVIVDRIDIALDGAGVTDKVLLKEIRRFPLEQGEPLNHADYEEGKRRLLNSARERGYFDADWTTHEVSVDEALVSAVVRLIFTTGERYRFGAVEIPETVVDAEVLKRMQPFKAGEPYHARTVIEYQERLRNSNYFSDVQVRPVLEETQENQVPLRVTLTPNKRNSYRLGGGYGTDTGPRLTLGWENRYLKRAGHKAEADLRLSMVLSSLSGSYLMPFLNDSNDQLGINGSLTHEDTDTSESDIFQLGVQRLTTRRGWNESLNLSYQFEDFTIAGIERTSNLLIPGLRYWRSRGDDPIYPRKGYHLSLALRGAKNGVLSDASFLQTQIGLKGILPLGQGGRLITRARIGASMVPEFNELPASLRFFAGGDNSIRGFDLDSLGPKNADGVVIGGKHLAIGSIELEHVITGNWSGALFTDFGNAFDHFDVRMEQGAGVGIRWRSPVGLIRVDVASGFSHPDRPIRLHIIMGPDL